MDITAKKIRDYFGPANERAAGKEMNYMDSHVRNFISHSPFAIIASSNAQGRCDATPRGDAPGFVKVVDEKMLLVPDRKGNNRIDTFMNVLENPRVGILFMVPGVKETVRVNGRARIEIDEAVLRPHAVQGQVPSALLVVEAEEVFFHCAKAFIRSDLWNPEKHVAKGTIPSLGKILADQIGGGRTEEDEEVAIQEGYRTRLY